MIRPISGVLMPDLENDGANPPEGARDKLIQRKQEWAEEGRLLTDQNADPARSRLPPGQREVKTWPVLDLGARPKIDLKLWRLVIDGLVENPVKLYWDDFNTLPQSELRSDI